MRVEHVFQYMQRAGLGYNSALSCGQLAELVMLAQLDEAPAAEAAATAETQQADSLGELRATIARLTANLATLEAGAGAGAGGSTAPPTP